MQTSSSGKGRMERDLQLPRLLDHQPTFLTHASAPSLWPWICLVCGGEPATFPHLSPSLSLSPYISWSVCPCLTVPLSLPSAFLLSLCPCVSSVAVTNWLPSGLHSTPHSVPLTDPLGHYI